VNLAAENNEEISMVAGQVSLVFSGGVALGAYQAGAYATMHEREHLWPRHLAGSSIGAVNAALIAGSAPAERVDRLREFWRTAALEPLLDVPWLGWTAGPFRHAHSWLGVLQTRLLGRPGLFRPRPPELMMKSMTSLYDLAPLRGHLEEIIDFDRLNGGDIRLSVVTTDIETGQPVVFDTGRGDRIGPHHLLATCGFLPDFPPVEIDGRLLGDGGLVANAPIEPVLSSEGSAGDLLCFVVDVFSPGGGRPGNLEEAAARRWDLLFGNQSRQSLASLQREYRLRWALGRLAAQLGPSWRPDPELALPFDEAVEQAVTIVYLTYRAPSHEAGPEKPFDFSRATLMDRWDAGALDMAAAIGLAADCERPRHGIAVHQVRR
jgi:NTE family protein